ncbi:hypothetical protein SAMN07250955_10660 [Arboricoccus pini]|uniref:Uncharacterized protein n=2 Tax=Arboricoccus pini TaxID=1963835 RepID=A0A212R6J7_9PROT|nr:hypothetical protein SAMN07250955_10660 [Arboricoccus pini]
MVAGARPNGSDTEQAMALARSLKDFAPDLGNFFGTLEDSRKQAMEQAYESKLGGLTLDEVKAKVAEGRIDNYDDPYFQAALHKGIGIKQAQADILDLQSRMAGQKTDNGDPIDPTDPDAIDHAKSALYQQRMGQYEGNEYFTSGYLPLLDQVGSQLTTAAAEGRNSKLKTAAIDTAGAAIEQTLSNGKASGADINTTLAGINSSRAGLMKVYNFAPQDWDNILLATADKYADRGDATTASAILDYRNEAGGSLSGKLSLSPKVSAIREKALAQQSKTNSEAFINARVQARQMASNGEDPSDYIASVEGKAPGTFSASERVALSDQALDRQRTLRAQQEEATARFAIDQQNANAKNAILAHNMAGSEPPRGSDMIPAGLTLTDVQVPKYSYGKSEPEMITYTAEQQRNDLAQRYFNQPDRPGETPSQRFERESLWAEANGITDGASWMSIAKSAPAALSVAGATGNIQSTNMKSLQTGYATYNALRTRGSDNYLARLLPQDTRDTYEGIRFLTTEGGQTFEDAARTVAKSRFDESKLTVEDKTIRASKLEDAVSGITSSLRDGWFSGPSGGGQGLAISNPGDIQARIRDLAQRLVVNGLPQDVAVAQAAKRVQDTTVNINGYATSSLGLPDGIAPAAEQYAQQWIKDHPEDELEAKDLKFVPLNDTGGGFAMVDARGGLGRSIIPYVSPQAIMKSYQDLKLGQLQDARAAEAARRENNARNAKDRLSTGSAPQASSAATSGQGPVNVSGFVKGVADENLQAQTEASEAGANGQYVPIEPAPGIPPQSITDLIGKLTGLGVDTAPGSKGQH